MHPRLFQSLVLIDPVIQQQNPGAIFAAASTRRRDVWPSRTAVAEGFKKSKFYQTWDARVLDLLVEHGLRDVPTALIPAPEKKAENTPVTLTTTKHQELFMFERPTYRGQPGVAPQDDKLHYADFNPSAPADYSGHPFYRPEAAYVFNHLPEIRPNVLWLFGEKSDVGKSKTSTAADGWAEKVSRTGVAVGGGGGVKHGQVEQAVVRDAGHLLAFEKVGDSAEVISEYLGRQTRQWKQRSDAFEKERMQKSQLEKSTIDQRWLDNVDLNGSFPNSKTKGGKSKI
jgi:pimeloyl-ACP methyl ester carboxylesterase